MRSTRASTQTQKRAVVSRRQSKTKTTSDRGSATAAFAAPSSLGIITRTQRPIMNYSKSGDGMVVVRHREFIADVTPTSTSFQTTSYSINPGLVSTFPWLSSTVARGYESYRFRKLKFIFQSNVSTATAGKVYLAIDFDAKDDPPVDNKSMTSFIGSVNGNPWLELVLTADTADLLKFGTQRYLRSGNLTGTDIKTYDVGNLIIATKTAASQMGEIYTEYEVELHTPVFDAVAQTLTQSAKLLGSSAVAANAYLGLLPTVTGGLPLSTTSPPSTNTITFAQTGQYLVVISMTGTGINSTLSPVTTGSTVALTRSFGFSDNIANAGTLGVVVYGVNVTSNGQALVVNFATVATTIASSNVYIAPFSYSLI